MSGESGVVAENVINNRERWFDVDSVASSLMGEVAARAGVRIPHVVETGTCDIWTKVMMPVCPALIVLFSVQEKEKRRSSAIPIMKKVSSLLLALTLVVLLLKLLLRRALLNQDQEEVVVIGALRHFFRELSKPI